MFAQLLRQRLAQAILALLHEGHGLTIGLQTLPGLLRHVVYDTNIHSRHRCCAPCYGIGHSTSALYTHTFPSLPLPLFPSYLSSHLIYPPIASSLSFVIIQEGGSRSSVTYSTRAESVNLVGSIRK